MQDCSKTTLPFYLYGSISSMPSIAQFVTILGQLCCFDAELISPKMFVPTNILLFLPYISTFGL